MLNFLDTWKPPAESCFCFESNLLCGDANLTEIPTSPQGVSINDNHSSQAFHARYFEISRSKVTVNGQKLVVN